MISEFIRHGTSEGAASHPPPRPLFPRNEDSVPRIRRQRQCFERQPGHIMQWSAMPNGHVAGPRLAGRERPRDEPRGPSRQRRGLRTLGWICPSSGSLQIIQVECYFYTYCLDLSKLLASLMRNYFPKWPSGAPLHTLSNYIMFPLIIATPLRQCLVLFLSSLRIFLVHVYNGLHLVCCFF